MAVQVEGPASCVGTKLAPETQMERILLQDTVNKLLIVHILNMTVEVGLGGQLLSTLRTRELDVEMNALFVHLHVALLVRLVAAVIEVTAVFEHLSSSLFLTLPSFQVLDVVPSQLSVIIKTFLTFLAMVLLCIVVDDLNVLVEVGVLLVAKRTCLLLAGQGYPVHCQLVSGQKGFLVEDFIAQVTRMQVLGLVSSMLSLHVLVQVRELVVTDRAGLSHAQVHHGLVSRQVILLGECFHTDIAHVF